jgi:hypothetical protein
VPGRFKVTQKAIKRSTSGRSDIRSIIVFPTGLNVSTKMGVEMAVKSELMGKVFRSDLGAGLKEMNHPEKQDGSVLPNSQARQRMDGSVDSCIYRVASKYR